MGLKCLMDQVLRLSCIDSESQRRVEFARLIQLTAQPFLQNIFGIPSGFLRDRRAAFTSTPRNENCPWGPGANDEICRDGPGGKSHGGVCLGLHPFRKRSRGIPTEME